MPGEPARKIEDIHAAVGFAATLDGVDPARIGALGGCASSGYRAVNDDRSVPSLVAPWQHNTGLGDVLLVPAVSETGPEAAVYGPYGHVRPCQIIETVTRVFR